MNLKKIRIISSAFLIFLMIVIFCFSAQNGQTSSNTSGKFAQTIVSFIYPEFDEFSPEEKQEFIDGIMLPVRKTAHFTLYMCLSVSSFWLFLTLRRYGVYIKALFAQLFCVLYAVSDELHQYFVPGRACAFGDVLIDSGGALLGGVLMTLLIVAVKPLHKFKYLY